jgi:hypothetical protein
MKIGSGFSSDVPLNAYPGCWLLIFCFAVNHSLSRRKRRAVRSDRTRWCSPRVALDHCPSPYTAFCARDPYSANVVIKFHPQSENGRAYTRRTLCRGLAHHRPVDRDRRGEVGTDSKPTEICASDAYTAQPLERVTRSTILGVRDEFVRQQRPPPFNSWLCW